VIPADKLLCTFFAGCAVGLCGGIIVHDWSMAAHAGEKSICIDRPDTTAYYVRKPSENHNTEHCEQVMRFSSPNWIPQFSHPLKGRRE
jgi:hypothetical protein